MNYKMADVEYEEKFKEMQKYLPFLKKVVEKLKQNNEQNEDKPRKAQLQKMEMLQDLLTNKTKKLKMESLLKCEGVLKKLHSKMEKSDTEISNKNVACSSNKLKTTDSVLSEVEIVDLVGPASPPPQQIEEVEPIVIPTERQCTPPIENKRLNINMPRQNRQEDRDEYNRSKEHQPRSHQLLTNYRIDNNLKYDKPNVRPYSHSKAISDRSYGRKQFESNHFQNNKDSSFSAAPKYNSTMVGMPKNQLHQHEHFKKNVRDMQHQNNFTRQYLVRDYSQKEGGYRPQGARAKVGITSTDKPNNSIPIIDLVEDSSKVEECKKDKGMFHRYKHKHAGEIDKNFVNFKVNIQNDKANNRNKDVSPETNKLLNYTHHHPVRVPSIPEVLKSPPLSASDIYNLLNENMDSNSVSAPSNCISEVGTRRTSKVEATRTSTPTSELDMVRKKLAMMVKNCKQFEESPASPVDAFSPSLPVNSTMSSSSGERLALKYHPHPRVERVEIPVQPYTKPYTDNKGINILPTPKNANVLPVINLNDPRIRKKVALNETVTTAISSVHPRTSIGPSVSYFQNNCNQSVYKNNQNVMTNSLQFMGSSNNRSDSWYAGSQFSKTSTLVSNKPFPSRIPAMSKRPNKINTATSYNFKETQNFDSDIVYSQSSKISKDEYSSEENWDSEPEAVPTHPQAVTSKQIPNANTCHKNNSSQISSSEWSWDSEQNSKNELQKSTMPKTTIPQARNNRFNAKLNDQTERTRYFEFKKQKQWEPQLKSKFAKNKFSDTTAESDPRKGFVEKHPKKSMDVQKKGIAKTSEVNKLPSVVDTVKSGEENSILKSTTQSSESTLDKLYRTANFTGSTFPKTNTKFKIPKKQHMPPRGTDEHNITKEQNTLKEDTKKVEETSKLESKEDKNSKDCQGVSEITEDIQIKNPAEAILEDNSAEKETSLTLSLNENYMNCHESNTENENLKPIHILKRRNTLCALNSGPEVDNDQLISDSALLYEDIQKVEAQNVEELEKPNEVGIRNLAGLDDNCSVSTHNIITGKRRTRTSVNFNEVQQALSVFKHKKQTSPKQRGTKESPETKKKIGVKVEKKIIQKKTGLGKTAAATEAKRSAFSEQIRRKEENKNECDGTTNSCDTESLQLKAEGSVDEHCNRASTKSVDDDSDRHDMLEDFVQDILKPNANTTHIFSLLSQILNKEKMELVKKIIESGAADNAALENGNTKDAGTNNLNKIGCSVSNDAAIQQSELCEKNDQKEDALKKEKKFKKRNELDRLNDDIRDMFICEGVLTATGRRMCTLVAAANATKNERNIQVKNSDKAERTELSNEMKPKLVTTSPKTVKFITKTALVRVCKSKFILNAMGMERICDVKKSIAPRTPDSEKIDECAVSLNDTEMNSFSEENAIDEIADLKLRIRPRPKSKKLEAYKKLKALATKSKENDNKNHEIMKSATLAENESEQLKTNNIANNLRNTNPKWHSQSEYIGVCVVCNVKLKGFSQHYQMNHAENYMSRLAPNILEEIRQNRRNKPEYFKKAKHKTWCYSCPFCAETLRKSEGYWRAHFSIHTSEYNYQCSKCHKGVNEPRMLKDHLKKCIGGNFVFNKIFNWATSGQILGYVCHLCDFVQLCRKNLDRHYLQQHDCDEATVKKMGYTIELFNTDDVVSHEMSTQAKTKQSRDEINQTYSAEQTSSDIDLALSKVKTVNKLVTASPVKKGDEKLTGEVVFSAANTNVFMPTREINDSPTFAKNLLTIEQVESEDPLLGASIAGSNVTSITERLSQYFKNRQQNNCNGSGSKDDYQSSVEKSTIPPDDISETNEEQNTSFPSSMSEGNLVIAEDIETYEDSNNQDVGENTSVAFIASVAEDDDNWEDIEIIGSNKSSIIATASSPSKENKIKSRGIFPKYNRFFAAKAPKKFKKNTNVASACDVSENEKTHIDDLQKLGDVCIEPNTEPVISTNQANPTPFNNTNTTAFRPMITTLDDLLPDSPCHDPIELVPELAPSEPLQELNDIFSILESNFDAPDSLQISQTGNLAFGTNVACIDVDQQQTSMQEALDFVNEQQQQYDAVATVAESQDSSEWMKKTINCIQNLGYATSLKGGEQKCRFYCLCQDCTFLYSNEAVGLENHFLTEHTNIKWSGFCNTCNAQVADSNVSTGPYTLLFEMKHMLDAHTVTSKVKNDQKLQELEEKPRIKLRRLTGDCLSTSVTLNTKELEAANTPAADCQISLPGAIDTNTNLCDLLNAKPRPPTKPMPALYGMAASIPNLEDSLFKDVAGSEFAITSVYSGGVLTQQSVPQATTLSDCPLQITSVVSLSDNAASSDLFKLGSVATEVGGTAQSLPVVPIISNVCSLRDTSINLAATITGSGNLELAESEIIPAPCIRGDDAFIQTNQTNESLPPEARSVSIEPVMVSELVPVAQAVSGDFVITQTVSTQFDECSADTQLGFNISIQNNPSRTASSASNSGNASPVQQSTSAAPGQNFICMSKNCEFQTRSVNAMKIHLQLHKQRSASSYLDYLQCFVCLRVAKDIDDYFAHTAQEHSRNANAMGIKLKNKSSDTPEAPKACIKSTKFVRAAPSPNVYTKQLEETIAEIVAPTGIPENNLYRCIFSDCEAYTTETQYQRHLLLHINLLGLNGNSNFDYTCPHCDVVYHRASSIKTHIKTHARHRIFCYICMATVPHAEQIIKHFSEKHKCNQNLHCATLWKSDDIGVDAETSEKYLVYSVKPLDCIELQQYGEKLIADWQCKKAAMKVHFKPSEIDLLPYQPIFQREVSCAECVYKTKVRTNMFRHLLAHRATVGGGSPQLLPNVDPVNPVPCLSSNERHFDKMTNLASSSLIHGSGSTPATSNHTVTDSSCTNNGSATTKLAHKLNYSYIPISKRYTCGVPGCKYLSLSEDIFRTHLSTLHKGIKSYQCIFCGEEVSKRGSFAEGVQQHLRFHIQRLYQCDECGYLHYMKNVAERHVNEKHATATSVYLLTYERTVEGELDGTVSKTLITIKKSTNVSNNAAPILVAEPPPEKFLKSKSYKWCCWLCGFTTAKHSQMLKHCSSTHNIKEQYQCVHCSHEAGHLSHIMTHIDEQHPGKTREARQIYHSRCNEPDQETDTTPLWQRNDPKRVRNIRGILMEDEEEAEQYRKRLCLDDSCIDEDDSNEVDSVAGSTKSVDDVNSAISEETTVATVSDHTDVIATLDSQAHTIATNANNSGKLFLGYYTFGCYFECEWESDDLELLKKHTLAKHEKELSSKGFFFRLNCQLKCPECLNFCGNYLQLQRHLQRIHKVRRYAAVDVLTKPNSEKMVCGYCKFSCLRHRQSLLYKHHRRVSHYPNDLKYLNSEHVQDIMKLGQPTSNVMCSLCNETFANRSAIVTHALVQHAQATSFSFRDLQNAMYYRCSLCSRSDTEEYAIMQHMLEHFSNFKYCPNCLTPQKSYHDYLQHYYVEHRSCDFKEFCSYTHLRKELQQMIVIFPNGLMLSKYNLRSTSYGEEQLMEHLYAQICQMATQPPIPRLSLGRLLARKSSETSKLSTDNEITVLEEQVIASTSAIGAKVIAGKICKRRNTVAFGHDEAHQFNNKREKLSINISPSTPQPSLLPSSASTVPVARDDCFLVKNIDQIAEKKDYSDECNNESSELTSVLSSEPFSFYGHHPDKTDLSNVYTNIAVGGVDKAVKLDKFSKLFKLNASLRLDRVKEQSQETQEKKDDVKDEENVMQTPLMTYESYCHIKKACPASKKNKYV